MSGYDYKEIFVEEAREQIDVLNDRLLIFEKDPNNMQVINDIFRVAHTLKSSFAFVGLQELSSFCHKIETLLQRIKDKTIVLSDDLMDIIFASLDKIKDSIELFIDKDEITKEFANLPDKIDKYILGEVTPAKKDSSTEQDSDLLVEVQDSNIMLNEEELEKLNAAEERENKYYLVYITFESNIKMKWVRAELVYANMTRLGNVIISFPPHSHFSADMPDRIGAILACHEDVKIENIRSKLDVDLVAEININELTYEEVLNFKQEPHSTTPEIKTIEPEKAYKTEKLDEVKKVDKTILKEKEEEIKEKIEKIKEKIEPENEKIEPENEKIDLVKDIDGKSVLTKSDTVRVPIKRLDELLNLVGELAITNSGFIEVYGRFKQLLGNKEVISEFEEKIDSLSNIAKNLQESIMQSRMVPIGTVFSRFTRLVRDLSKNLDKKVVFSFKGEETELDKKIIDVIGEPLIHLIRNALDHGLESVDDRKTLGKNESGKILLDAYQRGNHIFVEVSDDGKGLDRNKILSKAIETNAITEEDADDMPENEIYNLIFLHGFSTKKNVTSISGRGVGMDVVSDTVAKLNGSVSVKSVHGEGSTFTLSFPLTLAIVPAILVECGVETYAIPLSNVVETIKVTHGDIKSVDFNDVIQLRESVIPLLHLDEVFDIKITGNGNGRIPIVVSDFNDKNIGIVVDKLLGKREIVIKALSQNYQEVRGISGATILGNGKIALILDVPTLIERSRGISYRRRLSKKKHKKRNLHTTTVSDMLKDSNDIGGLQEILDSFELDIVSYGLVNEIIKVALATSSNNLNRFLNKDVLLAVPGINVNTYDMVIGDPKFTGADNMYFASCMLEGDLEGNVVISLNDESMIKLFKDLVGDDAMLSPVGQSCIMEICNLLTAGITNTISRSLKIKAFPMPPVFYYESYSTYFHDLIEEHSKENNYIWTIDTDIIIDSMIIEGRVFFIPYDSSFRAIGKAVSALK